MGLDWQCIPVPLDAAPVQAIREDAALWEIADMKPPFAELEPGEGLPQISRDLLAVLPAGTAWIDHFDRRYEQVQYLLDPVGYRNARDWDELERTLPYRIIHGDELFAEHAHGGQGPLWHCSTTAFLAAAVHRMDTLDVAVVREEFSVAEMSDLGVYKAHREYPDEQVFAVLLADLRGFADICRQAVNRNLDLIITLW